MKSIIFERLRKKRPFWRRHIFQTIKNEKQKCNFEVHGIWEAKDIVFGLERLPNSFYFNMLAQPVPRDWPRPNANTMKSSSKLQKAEINFTAMAPDPGLMPVEDFRKCLNQVLKEQGASLLQYGSTLGYLPLRQYIANHLRQYGILANSDEILLTNGSQQALDLISKMLIYKGAPVLVESPTYSLLIPLLHSYQAKISSIPMTDSGLAIDSLKDTLENEQYKFLYTIPNFHNNSK